MKLQVASKTAASELAPHKPKSSKPLCGAMRRRMPLPCTRPAGWATDHPGLGRCKFHGGNNKITHGRYAKIKREELRELIEQFAADPDPLNILPELHLVRALMVDYLNRYDQWREALTAWHESYLAGEPEKAKPRQILDISDAHRLAAEATKMVERIERIRSADAISRADLYRVMGEMGRIVEAVLELYRVDPKAGEEIKRAWLAIRV